MECFFWLFFCFFYSFFWCCSLSLFLVSIVCLFSDIYPIQKRMNHHLKVVYLWKSSQNLKIIRTQLIESALLWQEEKKTRRKQIKKQNIHSMNDDKKVIESTQWAHDLLFFSKKKLAILIPRWHYVVDLVNDVMLIFELYTYAHLLSMICTKKQYKHVCTQTM